ncbi:hypothetical protein FRC01_006398 [Tulasnella sp. 417]|nr:hypothetical protein FRC01_006398 [Tulasnella sp. 417]
MTTPNDHNPPTRPLSEKAKGKQRAVEVDDADASGPSSSNVHRPHSPATRVVTIRFTEGVKDLNLDISERETVRDIKSKEDIATIRRQFRSSRGLDQDAGPLEEEDQDEHARALEEQWIDSLDGAGGAVDPSLDGSPDGLYTTLLQGVAIGFFYGLIPFYFFRSRRRPAAFFSDAYEQLPPQGSVIYSKRMQMALVIGFFVNFGLGILRYLYE